jgi:hypothetical protein
MVVTTVRGSSGGLVDNDRKTTLIRHVKRKRVYTYVTVPYQGSTCGRRCQLEMIFAGLTRLLSRNVLGQVHSKRSIRQRSIQRLSLGGFYPT